MNRWEREWIHWKLKIENGSFFFKRKLEKRKSKFKPKIMIEKSTRLEGVVIIAVPSAPRKRPKEIATKAPRALPMRGTTRSRAENRVERLFIVLIIYTGCTDYMSDRRPPPSQCPSSWNDIGRRVGTSLLSRGTMFHLFSTHLCSAGFTYYWIWTNDSRRMKAIL